MLRNIFWSIAAILLIAAIRLVIKQVKAAGEPPELPPDPRSLTPDDLPDSPDDDA